MPNQIARKIVMACENENARSLVDSVQEKLTDKLVEVVETIHKDIGSKIFENVADINSGSWEDKYESYSPEIQEAIDQVIESVNEEKDLDESICKAASDHKVDKEKLREYFDSMNEDTITVDSTKETGEKTLKNAERMDDEDISKRIRYEATAPGVMEAISEMKVVAFDSGEKEIPLSDFQVRALKTVFGNLNEENQTKMVETLTESHAGFVKMVSWCVQVTK